MSENKIIQGNSLEILKQIEDESIDCIITDPPYGYSFMGKDWDKAVVSVDVWRECLRVLKDGSFSFVMSAPRQDVLSRMIVNLQDAGFRTDFTSIYWTYASGFPKAANVSKLVDKRLGVEREIIGYNPYTSPNITNNNYVQSPKKDRERKPITISKSEQAKKLDGSYAGFQPKPAVEVILVVMKPLSENTFVDQALNNGKGMTWLDDCRIPFQNEKDLKSAEFGRPGLGNIMKKNFEQGYRPRDYYEGRTFDMKPNEKGRFPANLLVSDDALNGHSKYFDLDVWYSANSKEAQFIITPKASRSERNKGCEDLPLKEVGYNNDKWSNLGIFDNKYTLKPENKSDRKCGYLHPRQNFHPTVKPLKLMSYLITLGSRENDIVLDPFCGSGTTLIAAHQLNRKWIGIELSKEYAEIARKRIEHYLKQSKLIMSEKDKEK